MTFQSLKKSTAVAGLLLVSCAAARSAEPEVAFSNLAHEFATCAAFFGVVSIALDNSDAPDTADEYELLMEHALQYAATAGEGIGLLPETAGSRFEIAVEEMQARIGGNTSNISILYTDHMAPCTAAMEDPEGRIAYWMAK